MTFLLDVIGPLFILIGCGYFLGRSRKIDTEPLANVAIYICLPFLLFSTLVRHPVNGLAAAQIFVWQAGMYLCSVPAIWLVTRLAGWDQPTRSAVTLSLPTVNVASYGVPVVLFALGDGVMWPSVESTVARVGGVEDQGAVQGIADSAGSLANIIGLLLGGIAYESVGPKTFLLSAGCALVAFVLSLRLLRR